MIRSVLKSCFLGVVFILSFYSCSSTKSQVIVEKELEIVNAYYQELIPGQESQKTKYNFYIKLENEADIIDSISYQNEIKYLIKRKNYYETDLGKKINKRDEELILFYHNNEGLFRSSLKNILIKEPLYLP